jgi:MSHA biogenesis protein MshI
LLPLLKKRLLPGLTGVGLQPEGVCVVRVERAAGRPPAVTLFDFRPWGNEPREKLLERLAMAHDLGRAHCTTVLDPNDYTLLLTEAPEVPAEELRAAIRWRIKDLIDFHINDATLDVFDLPGEKAAGRVRSMYVVAARSAAIQKRVDLLDAAGIHLDVIDIPEMAQRNLAALLPEDVKGVVLLSFTPGAGLITITKQAEIYLSRNIDIGLSTFEQAADRNGLFDRIVLEVQRSLDYFDSHFRQAPVGHLVLAPLPREIPGLVDHLKANLNVAVSIMDLTKLLDCRVEIASAQQAVCLGALGAALRQEERAL